MPKGTATAAHERGCADLARALIARCGVVLGECSGRSASQVVLVQFAVEVDRWATSVAAYGLFMCDVGEDRW